MNFDDIEPQVSFIIGEDMKKGEMAILKKGILMHPEQKSFLQHIKEQAFKLMQEIEKEINNE